MLSPSRAETHPSALKDQAAFAPGHPRGGQSHSLHRAKRGSSLLQPQRKKCPGKKATTSFGVILAGEQDSFLEQPNMARAGSSPARCQCWRQEHGGTTQQANIKVRKRGFGSRGPQSLPGSVGPTWSSALGTSSEFVTVRSLSPTGDSTGESPKGRAVQGTAFPLPGSCGKEQPPRHSASTHG